MIPSGDMHQSFIDIFVKSFFDNFLVFANSFSVLYIHYVAPGLDANVQYKCPAPRGGPYDSTAFLLF